MRKYSATELSSIADMCTRITVAAAKNSTVSGVSLPASIPLTNGTCGALAQQSSGAYVWEPPIEENILSTYVSEAVKQPVVLVNLQIESRPYQHDRISAEFSTGPISSPLH